jgi:copper chaperone CopZ
MKTTIKIQNLKCGGCAATISNQLKSIDNLQQFHVNVETKEVEVEYDSVSVLENIKLKLEKIGYPEAGNTNSVVTKAKSYVSCAIGKLNT